MPLDVPGCARYTNAFNELTQGSLKQEQVCDAPRCSGLRVPYADAFNEFMTLAANSS